MQPAAQASERDPVADRISALMRLARRAEPEARGALYNSVANLVVARGEHLTNEERDLARQVLSILTHQVETEIRRALALRLADRPDAPHDLILMLANDSVRVAEPVLLNSAVLTDSDLVLIIRNATSAHQTVVARRSNLSALVSEALIEHGGDGAVGTLLTNASAIIPADALRMLVNRAAFKPALHAPLVQRDDLPADVIEPLFKMVSTALKAHIQAHYTLPAGALEKELTAVLNEAALAQPSPEEARAMLMVDKLDRAQTLGPSFLLKALSEGQHDLFVHGFARLLHAAPEKVRQLMATKDFRPFALATRVLGIDRSVFLTIWNTAKRGEKSEFDAAQKAALDEIFLRTPIPAARQKLIRLGICQS